MCLFNAYTKCKVYGILIDMCTTLWLENWEEARQDVSNSSLIDQYVVWVRVLRIFRRNWVRVRVPNIARFGVRVHGFGVRTRFYMGSIEKYGKTNILKHNVLIT